MIWIAVVIIVIYAMLWDVLIEIDNERHGDSMLGVVFMFSAIAFVIGILL